MVDLEVCCFCNQVLYDVYDKHNAMPVQDDWCCERCNADIVISARLNLAQWRTNE